jgi:hypothetical protein
MGDHKPTAPRGLVLSLLASVALAVAGLFLVRWVVPGSWLQANNDVAGNYLQTIGTIYAVLLAFVVFVVWQQHNDVRGAVYAEANELSDTHRLIQTLPEAVRTRVSQCLYDYREAVMEEEWSTLANGQPSERAARALEEVWQVLQRFEPQTRREEILYGELIECFNDLGDARTHRLHCSCLRLPPSLWALLVINGALVVGSMWLFGLESFAAHALMTLALAGSIALILYLIADMDNPFWGAWRVTPDAFRAALDRAPGPHEAAQDSSDRNEAGNKPFSRSVP